MSMCTFLGKYILYWFNLLCMVSSVGILTIAFIINARFYRWANFMSDELTTMPKILGIIGLGLFVIAFIGLCAMVNESPCLLTLFSILLSMVLIGELVFSAIVYNMRNDIESYALQQMQSTMNTYNKTGHETSSQIWNLVQSDMECCGIYGPSDWKNVTNSDKLPKYCCKEFPLNGSCKIADSFKEGCYSTFITSLQDNNQLIILSAIGFGFIQLLAVCLACCRKCSIHDAYETV